MLRYLTAAAAAIGLTAAALPGFAAAQEVGELVVHGTSNPDVEVKTQVVNVSDLDLSVPYDARVLMHRINTAARNVCSPQPIKELWEYPDYNRCMAEAIDSARAQADSPLLDDLYRNDEVASNY